mgnify:CR=1 FL=1
MCSVIFLKEQTVPVKEAVLFSETWQSGGNTIFKMPFPLIDLIFSNHPSFLCLLLQKKLPMSEPDTGSYGGSPVPTVLLHPDHPLHRKVPVVNILDHFFCLFYQLFHKPDIFPAFFCKSPDHVSSFSVLGNVGFIRPDLFC